MSNKVAHWVNRSPNIQNISTAFIVIWLAQASPAAYWKAYWTNWLSIKKNQAIKKSQTALTYPIAIIVVAVALIFIMMMFVLPAFKEVYANMGAELPRLTQLVMSLSDLFVDYGWIMIILLIVSAFGLYKLHEKSPTFQKKRIDALILRLPVFGAIVRKATIARWARTTSTLFAAGVPLVEVLDSVAGASGNILYEEATQDIRAKVTQGLSLTSSMQSTDMFPNMVIQMAAIGEESGSLDDMLNKAAEFYEDEVDNPSPDCLT